MEWMIIALSAAVVMMLILYGITRKKYVSLQDKYERRDLEYTKLLAQSMEQEKELKHIRQNYDRQQELATEIKGLHEKTRLLKHDMKNHIMVITSYLNENRIDDAKQYISNIMDELNKMYTYIQVGNALLSYIINSKFQEAAKRGVEVKAEISNLPFEGIESVDFSALLNNLLDNAIEGACRSEDKKIVVNILEKRGWSSIYVANTIRESVLEKNPELVSTKEGEEHGYGMKQILRIAEKYQGMTDIYEEDGCFCVNVMFPG